MDNHKQIQVFCLEDFITSAIMGQHRISSKFVLDRSHNNQTNQKKIHLHQRYVEWIMGSFMLTKFQRFLRSSRFLSSSVGSSFTLPSSEPLVVVDGQEPDRAQTLPGNIIGIVSCDDIANKYLCYENYLWFLSMKMLIEFLKRK